MNILEQKFLQKPKYVFTFHYNKNIYFCFIYTQVSFVKWSS